MGPIARRLKPARVKRILGAASCVRERARFVANELRPAGSPVERRYRLRGSERSVRLRQPLLDLWVLEEVFRSRAYRPPPEAEAALAGRPQPLRVLDLGGYVGLFGVFAEIRWPGARIVSFEPDPGNAATLARCIEDNRLGERWELVEAAAATRDDEVEFVSSYHHSRVAAAGDPSLDEFKAGLGEAFDFLRGTPLLTTEPRRVRALDVFPSLAGADLVKMDIEGGEWELLSDPRLGELGAAALVLEYHPAYGPGDAEGSIRRALEPIGYRLGPFEPGPDGGLVWAWRTS